MISYWVGEDEKIGLTERCLELIGECTWCVPSGNRMSTSVPSKLQNCPLLCWREKKKGPYPYVFLNCVSFQMNELCFPIWPNCMQVASLLTCRDWQCRMLGHHITLFTYRLAPRIKTRAKWKWIWDVPIYQVNIYRIAAREVWQRSQVSLFCIFL